MKKFFAHYNVKYITGVTHNPTGQAVIEGSNCSLKEMLNGTGEMAQWLRALPALPKVLSSIPNNHMVAHNYL